MRASKRGAPLIRSLAAITPPGVWFFLAILVANPATAAVANDEDPSSKAAGHLAAGRLDEALEAALELAASQPAKSESWEPVLEVFEAAIAEDKAEGLMKTAVGLTEILGDYAGPWILKGKVYLGQAGAITGLTGFEGTFRRGLLFEAANAFRTALDRDPDSSSAGSHLAFTLFLMQDFSGARREAQAVLGRRPDHVYAVYLLGEIEMRLERPEHALEMFQRAFETDGGMLEALSGTARALTALERRTEARDAILMLARKDGENREIPYLASSIFEADERYLDAAALYSDLLAILPERTDLSFYLAVVEYRLEDLERARRLLDEILRREPSHEGALYYRALLFDKQRQYDEAVPYYTRALACEGLYLEHTIYRLRLIAFTFASTGRYKEAVSVYDRLTPILPFDTDLASNRALALAQCGLVQDADEAYAAILEVSPDDTQILNDFALHLVGSGRIEKGIEILERAYAIDGNLDSCENLGAYYYYTLGDLEKAGRYFELVLEADPFREKSLILFEAIERRRIDGGD